MNRRARFTLGFFFATPVVIAACSGSSGDDSGATVGDDGGSVDGTIASGDAAANDSGPVNSDGGTTTPDAGDPCANSFFCDDFEEYDAGNAPTGKWTTNPNGGTIAIATDKAHSGHNSVKIVADSTSGFRSMLLSYTDATKLPVTGNHVYGRMMFFLDSSPTTSVHWTFMDGYGETSGGYHAFYRYGGQSPETAADGGFLGNGLMANYDTPDSYNATPVGPSTDCYLHSTTVVPVGVWSCAEFEFDGPNNTMKFTLNGAPVTDLTMNGTGEGCVSQSATYTWLAPVFTQLDVGLESYQADSARTMWVDDVAFGTAPLSCMP